MRRHAPLRTLARASTVALASLGLALIACATPAPGPAAPGATLGPTETDRPFLDLENQLQARGLAVEALELMAQAHHELLTGQGEEGVRHLVTARERVQAARKLMPAERVPLRGVRGKPAFVTRVRDTVEIPLAEIDPDALARVRPYRKRDATVLRVDLEELERHLGAAALVPESALREIVLAANRALEFGRAESGGSLAGESASAVLPSGG